MGSRAHPNSVWPHLNGLHLPRLYFQSGHILRFHVELNFGGARFNPYICAFSLAQDFFFPKPGLP